MHALILLPVLGVMFVINMMAALMFEVPVGENKSNPRTMTYRLEKIYCWLGDDVCEGFRKFFLIDKGDSEKSAAYRETKTFNNKYSVIVSNKNWTWSNIVSYERAFFGGSIISKESESFPAFKRSNALYLNDKPIGVLFDISFENEEPKLIFVLRDDIKIKPNSHLEQRGRDFVIIENSKSALGVYDDKKEFKYIDNNNSLPYENNEEIEEKSIVVRGLQIANLSPTIANKYKIYGKKGVVVTKYYNQTLASHPIYNGDLIVSLAGKPVENVKDFCNIIVNTTNPLVEFLRQGVFHQHYIIANPKDDECLAYIKKRKK